MTSRELKDLTDPATLRAVMARAGLRVDRRWGQHFLIDPVVRDAVVAALDLPPAAAVYEIGCGPGTLTQALAETAARVVAVDVDPGCVRAASALTRHRPHITVLEADAREVDPAALGFRDPWYAAGNLPYQLTGVLLNRCFELPQPPHTAAFLVQREVAARLAAAPGDWSLATVALRSVASVERLRDVPPQAFLPPPAVHSSVIRLRPRHELSMQRRQQVIALAKAVFQQRRKTLRHGLAHALGEAAAAEVIRRTGVDSRRRPGTLALDEWETLATEAAALTAPR